VAVSRGDIVIVALDPTRGSEQAGTRHCVVVQNDVGNENAPTTIVLPCTTSFGEDLYPFEVFLPAREAPLSEDSVALANQIRTVSIADRTHDNLGSISDDRIDRVETALEYSLGLRTV